MWCIGAAVVIALSEPLAIAIFDDAAYQEYIILFSLTMILLPLIGVPFAYIRAMQNSHLFFNFQLLKRSFFITSLLFVIIIIFLIGLKTNIFPFNISFDFIVPYYILS